MSEWNDIDDSAIEINFNTRKVEIHADSCFGADGVILTFDQIKKICERIKHVENHESR